MGEATSAPVASAAGVRPTTTLLAPEPAPGCAAEPTFIGEDGEFVVGRGHVEPRVFACLAVAMQAKVIGILEADDMVGSHVDPHGDLDHLARLVSHHWAVELAGPEDLDHEDYGIVPPGDPFLRWTNGVITADTPGAIPVTVLDLQG